MPSIDERVVEMKFKDDQFKKGIAGTLASLTGLKKGLDMKGATKGLQDVEKAGKSLKLDAIANGVEGLQSKFSALSIAGITALTNIANKAVDTGLTIAKSLTVDPIADGYNDYMAKLTSTQTIMNATGKPLKVVEGFFKDLDIYADKTIYDLTDMTGAFAKFTNAGVDMDKSVPAIKGIANMVALAGQDANAAGIAMYNLSQSIAGGFLTTTDYKSLNLANVATKEWKSQIIDASVAAGTLKKNSDGLYTIPGAKGAYDEAALFNDTLKEGWATTEVLLKVFGDYGNETTKIGKKAQAAAQDVKSWGMMMETLSASVGTGWTDTFELLFGNIEESKKLFTPLTETIGGFLDSVSAARNEPIAEWKDMGGRDLAIQAIADAFTALFSVLTPIKDAFREIFPAMTGKDLYNFTKVLADLAKSLTISGEAAENLKRTFRGVFAVLDIGWMVIKGLVGVILDLLGVIFEGSGGFLEFTGNIGDWLVSVRDAIKNGEGLTKFFEGLSNVVKKPIEWIKALAKAIGDFFSQVGSGGGDGVTNAFNPLVMLGEFATGLFKGLWGLLKGVAKFFAPFASDFMAFISDLGAGIGDMAGNMNFDHVLGLINTGLFGGLVLLLRKFVKGEWLEQVKGMFGGGEDGLISNITGIFGGLNDTLSAMQTNLKAGTLIKIAGAIALLTASVVALSLIDAGKLAKALSAISVMFLQLGVALLLFEKFSSGMGFVRMPFIAASLILLGAAILVLSAAVNNLSGLNWGELAKGLVGVGGLLASLNLFMAFAKTSKGAVANGAGLILLGVAINILARAVGKFADLEWGQIAKGLTTLAGLFTLLGLFSAVVGKTGGLVAAGAGMILMATALNILLKPIKEFGNMDWGQIAKSLVMLAGALILFAAAGAVMTGAIPGAIAMTIMAAAIRVLAPALVEFGEMKWSSIAKAMVTLAGSLILLAAAAYVMTGALPGAAALIVMATAIRILTPALMAMASLEWNEILRGLTMLAGALTVLGIAGILILPAIPGLLLLGVAITLLGTGTMLAGVGLMMFATALGLLAVTGGAAIAVLIASVQGLLGLIPFAMEQLALGFQTFVTTLAGNAAAINEAFVIIASSILDGINTLAPKIVATLITLIWLLINTILGNIPKFADAGARIIIGFLNGLASNMGGIITAGTNVIVSFLQGIQANAGRVADEGAKTVIAFINATSASIRANSGALRAAASELGWAIADGLTGGLASKARDVAAKAAAVGRSAIAAIKGAIDSNSPSKESMYLGEFIGDGLAVGMDNRLTDVDGAGSKMGGRAIDSLKSALSGMGSVIDSEMDTQPVIAPVLDLTGVRKAAGDISGMMGSPSLDPSTTRSRANLVGQNMRRKTQDAETQAASEGGMTFIQNNHSPKALSTTEIYRQSKNLISTAKG